MKKIILLAFAFSFYVTNAQDFKTSDKYTLTNERFVSQDNDGKALVDLVLREDSSATIAVLDIVEKELLDAVNISVLSNPDLEDITEIIKVELEYSACCVSTDTYYFMLTSDNDFIALPHIENLYCDTTQIDTHYVFPSQSFGQEGAIVKAELQYNEKYTIKDIKVLQSIVLNDDDFDYEDAITAIY